MICSICTREEGCGPRHLSDRCVCHSAYHDLLFLCRRGRSFPWHLSDRCVCQIAYHDLLFLYRGGRRCPRHLSDRCICHIAYHDLLFLYRRAYSGPHDICQTDACVISSLPTMICCFCTGDDGVAHGIGQTDASVIIAFYYLLFLCRSGRSCPRYLSARSERHHCLQLSVVSVQERTELPTASVRQMRLSHCLTWSVVSVQERTELPTASVRQMRASSLPRMT